jgi:O-antigen ligase
MGFSLLLVVVALLFLRPGDILPALDGAPLYELAILACLACSAGRVTAQLNGLSLSRRPITALILGLLGAVVLSHLSHVNLSEALSGGVKFFKLVLLYLLLVGNLNTPARLQRFLAWLTGLITVVAMLSVLQHHGYIDAQALEALEQTDRDEEGDVQFQVTRLRGAGIFNDPNDLCVILAVGVMACFQRIGESRGAVRLLWGGSLALCGYGMILTHSRGGLLALLAGLFALLKGRFGVRKGAVLGVAAVPVLLVLIGGRQATLGLDNSADTSQHRIRLWSDGFALMRSSPAFGIGQGTYAESLGLVAHNSFVEVYTETGFFGGTLFVGAFAYALWGLNRLVRRRAEVAPAQLQGTSAYLLAMVAALAAGLLSLSRVFSAPTYIILGVAMVQIRLVSDSSPALAAPVNSNLVKRLLVTSLLTLACLHAFILSVVRWS